ncbi:50S ribosomal protein L23 [Candidatus Sumerlaeota bacterium]|nr:50S ribosomal protein L23 [Candidatus Sumerlaeota bacterium]
MRDPWSILIKPIITEKSYQEASGEEPKYEFKVRLDSNKQEIKKAVEQAFSVKVKKVNVMRIKGSPRRVRSPLYGKTSQWKKAIVTLESGHKIDLF